MARLRYPIGVQTFSIIREEGYVYADKTGYLHNLLERGAKNVFLSRPRRFGKSLFLSMVDDFFRGRRELFEGLEISRYDYDWQPYPVFHFDFTGVNYDSPKSVEAKLNGALSDWESKYGVSNGDERYPGLRFEKLIKEVHKKYCKRVVVLVDEYDKPLLETVDNPELQEKFRNVLRGLYGNLKSQDAHIRFAMLTGVTKFGHLSIFSDLNNLQDISMDEDYSGICGITSVELRQYFDDGVRELADRHSWSVAEAYDKLRLNYDGYHFSAENAPDIYNPFSIINALNSRRISDYWFKTGTPTFLVKMIKKMGVPVQSISEVEVDADSVSSVPFDFHCSLFPVLYQSGYLTIKGYNGELNLLRLGFPNREVEQGFFKQLIQIYAPASRDLSGFSITDFYRDVMSGNAEAFMMRLQGLFADFNQDGFNRIGLEQHYQDVMYILMKLMGFYSHIEYKTASGRIDLVVKTPGYIYVFEFKMDRSPQEALDQINGKGYLLPFNSDSRHLVKIGANFSSKTHTLDGWIIE
ncbi:MAG: ATP-binding protein [Clostridium sp.]|nr:ATP-binding protein [Clostridium sp.]